jgi:cbb3-type cytochrome oxidase maturation protein
LTGSTFKAAHFPFPILNFPFPIMTIFYLLIGCSIAMALIFLVGFLWSIRSGQYDDTYTPSVRMLFEPGELQQNEPKAATPTDSSNTKLEPSQPQA